MAQNTEKVAVHAQPVEAPTGDVYTPLADIYELPDGTMVVEAEMPGATNDTIDVQVDKGVLTIQGRAKLETPGEPYSNTYSGFSAGQYFRAFALSDEIDRDKIEASLKDGLLTLRLPKAAAARTRKIEIKS